MEPLTGNPFRPLLDREGLVLLDGGLATALEADGWVLDSSLWSARLLLDAPDAIRAVHTRYLEAGADCITTASYQASFPGFASIGIGESEAEAVLHRSTALALEARAAYLEAAGAADTRTVRPLVAASIGPYGAYLADGSEYVGRYGVGADELTAFHGRRFAVLAETGADLLACETIPSGLEADVLLRLLDEHPETWAWLSFSCEDGLRLRDGTPIESVVSMCSAHDRVSAVGVNCTDPRHIAELVARAATATDLPLIAYPNSGERYDAVTGCWSGAGSGWLEGVVGAFRAGARIVGGCCRIGPGEIRELRAALSTEGRRDL